jgi:hypothetical protein
MDILDFPTAKSIIASKVPKPEDGIDAAWLDRYE